MANSLRDEIKDRIRVAIAGCNGQEDISEVDADLVACIADAVFDAMCISERFQDMEYVSWVS